jgi:hypothetical protein
MTSGDRFRTKTPDVTHEVIDDEAVIINLETGHYYSPQGTGADIWTLVTAEASVGAIVDHLTQSYACERSEIEPIVSSLIAQLQEERLIVPLEAGHPTTLPQTIPSARPLRSFQCLDCRSTPICRNCFSSTPFTRSTTGVGHTVKPKSR